MTTDTFPRVKTWFAASAIFASDIKLAHSVFALPFAASAIIIGKLPVPTLRQSFLLLVCMVTARTFAMGMNRYLDRAIDSANPRTMNRALPANKLQPGTVLIFNALAAISFVVAAANLNTLAAWCSVPLLALLAIYGLMKRWTWICHLYLGFCLGLAPVAVAVALTGGVTTGVIVLALAVMVWTAGFDCLYALLDLDFDRKLGVFSIPARFGPRRALWISRLLFSVMVFLLVWAGIESERGLWFYIGIGAVSAMLIYEHWLVRGARHDGRSDRLNAAFFTANAWVSVLFFGFCLLDTIVSR